jgi:hypothetical protein
MFALAAPTVPKRPDPVGALSAAQTKAALDRKSFVADTPRQISTLFGGSDVANHPPAMFDRIPSGQPVNSGTLRCVDRLDQGADVAQ